MYHLVRLFCGKSGIETWDSWLLEFFGFGLDGESTENGLLSL